MNLTQALPEPDIPLGASPPETSPTIPPSTSIVYVPVPITSSTAVTVTVPKETWNPAADGVSFTDLIGILSFFTLLIGLGYAIKKFRRERNEAQEETIRRVVSELKPAIDTVQHELTNNGGSSMKDRSDQSHVEMRSIRADISHLMRNVDKMENHLGFFARKAAERDQETARLGERLRAVEQQAQQRQNPSQSQESPVRPLKGARRWRL
jgi:hypothetical protein